jgi:hypothetical protein
MFDKSCQIPKRFDFCDKKYILYVKKYFTIITHNFMDKQFDSLKLNESAPKHLSKAQKFVENTKRAVRNALTTT